MWQGSDIHWTTLVNFVGLIVSKLRNWGEKEKRIDFGGGLLLFESGLYLSSPLGYLTLCASVFTSVVLANGIYRRTVVMSKWTGGGTALKSGSGSPKSQLYCVMQYPEPGAEICWVSFLTSGLQSPLGFEELLCELMWPEKSLWDSRILKCLARKHILKGWIKKEKKSRHDEIPSLDSKLENQGEIDNYRFLLQTTRPFSRLTFLCARQKITTNLQTEVCIR